VERTDPVRPYISKPINATNEKPDLTSPMERLRKLQGRVTETLSAHRDQIISALKKTGSVLMYGIILLLVFIAYGSIPNRWYKVITIEGNSMSPTLKYGDLVVITRPPRAIEEGTIVTLQVEDAIVTHRYLGYDENGRRMFKGDANLQPDDFSRTNYRIIGVVKLRIPLLGHINIQANKALDAIQGTQGTDRNEP